MKVKKKDLPWRLLEQIVKYIDHGVIIDDGFLYHTLAGDRVKAVEKDRDNFRSSIFKAETYIKQVGAVPSKAHGSYQAVNEWIKDGGIAGHTKRMKK